MPPWPPPQLVINTANLLRRQRPQLQVAILEP
jgi:hypothetical protein